MADPPDIAPILPPPPPRPSRAPVPPAPPPTPIPPSAFAPAERDPPRDLLYDAFYEDERNIVVPRSANKIKTFYNMFTGFNGPPSYDNAWMMTAVMELPNPLSDSKKATVLPQTFKDLETSSATTRQSFDRPRTYYVFAPKFLLIDYASKPQRNRPKARLSLFFGVGGEINFFGLRNYFSLTDDCVLINIPGVEEDRSRGIDRAWGIGITSDMIKQLLAAADLKGIEFTVEVIAGYSTGYRGVNLTVINRLVELFDLRRLVYLDAFYQHDDFPLARKGSRQFDSYFKRNTLWAIDTALSARTVNPLPEVFVYAYTEGVGRRRDGTLSGPVEEAIKSGPGRIHIIELEKERDGVPAIAAQVEKICLARLIQGGIDDYFERSSVPPDIIALVDLLPNSLPNNDRGSFGTFGRPGFTNLYQWITKGPQKMVLSGFSADKAFAIVTKYKLLGDWTTSNAYNFRHRDFVQEICKECLLP
jgi:hypothetical protein